jgi:hypothetical protein
MIVPKKAATAVTGTRVIDGLETPSMIWFSCDIVVEMDV